MSGFFYIFVLTVVFLSEGTFAKKQGHLKSGGGKIIGGHNVTIEEFPYQVSLKISHLGDAEHQFHQCGGSIISASYILTAGHCLFNATEVQARIGSSKISSGGEIYTAAFTKIHPKYNPKSKDYDIALMRTDKKMQLDGTTTKIITLVERKNIIPSGSAVTVSGWGYTTPDGPVSHTLKALDLKTFSTEECKEKLGQITNRQFCAGFEDGSEDSCRGDSGGPIVLIDSKIQVGIVSASHACAVPDKPGIIVNVTDLREWIFINTGV